MKTKTIVVSCAELKMMSVDDLEQFAEQGTDYRYSLSCAVLRNLTVPDGCLVEIECESEYGGLYPVTLRFAKSEEEPSVEWYLSSAGQEYDNWTISRLEAAGQVTDLYCQSHFEPEEINIILSHEVDLFAKEVAA